MNKYLTYVLIALLLLSCTVPLSAQDADKPQFIVHFSLGPNWDADKPPQEQTGFADHGANMQRLRGDGVIRFGARYSDLGMLIIQADSREQAESIIKADPSVQHGIFNYSVEPVSIFYPWKNGGD